MGVGLKRWINTEVAIMQHMTHNYMLGLAVLVTAFIFFYTPIVYAFIRISKQRKQDKSS